MIAIDPILSQIMRALVRANPEDVSVYLGKALWLYENVDTDLFRDDPPQKEERKQQDADRKTDKP